MSQPERQAIRSRMSDVLGSSVYHALGLKESLVVERKALETQDVDALHAALEDKSRCVRELQDLEAERARICDESGIEAGPEQMLALADWCGDVDRGITSRWEYLLTIAEECNSLNMSNGAIIRVRKQQIDTGLAVLRGGAPESDTYGQGGMETGGPNRRSLAEA